MQGGLAILRQAMTLRLTETAKGRHYNKGDFKPLAVHYREKRFQIHVMMRYATLALEKFAKALTLVLDYFALGLIVKSWKTCETLYRYLLSGDR